MEVDDADADNDDESQSKREEYQVGHMVLNPHKEDGDPDKEEDSEDEVGPQVELGCHLFRQDLIYIQKQKLHMQRGMEWLSFAEYY